MIGKSYTATKSSIGNLLTSFIIYPITITTGIITARVLGVEGKGIYAFLILLLKSMIPIFFFGYTAGVNYYIASKKYTVKNSIVTNLVIATGVGFLIAAVIFLLWANNYLGKIGNDIELKLLLPVLIAIPLTTVFNVCSTSLKGDFKFKLLNTIQIVKAIGLVLLLLVLVILLDLGLQGAALALLTEALITFFALIYLFQVNYKPDLRFNADLVARNFEYGIKSWVGSLAQQSNDKLDQLLIGFFANSYLLGLYSVAFSIVKMMNFLPNAIAPVFFNLTAISNNQENEVKLTGQIHRSLFIIVGFASMIVAILSSYLVSLLYGEEFKEAATPLIILIPGMLAFAITRRVLSKYLAGKGMPEKTSLIQGFGAMVGAVLYFVLIPKYNIIGAASASTIAYIVSSILAIFIFKKETHPHRGYLFRFSLEDVRWIIFKLKPIFIKFKNSKRDN